MNRTAKIILVYTITAIVSVLILWVAFWVRSGLSERDKPFVINQGAEKKEMFFPIEKDFTAVNQSGQEVALSQLKGKVWVVGEFFAVCPHCAMRNGRELREIVDTFSSHPDFQLVCISIDPEEDNLEKIKEYASALNADTKNWWFLSNGNNASTHEYMEKNHALFSVRKRTDEADIQSNGKYAHDLGLALVNRNFEVLDKWPLAEAREQDPALYERTKKEMYDRIRTELESKDQP